MAFQIVEINEVRPGNISAKVSHEGNQVNVIIRAGRGDDLMIEKNFQAEIDYDEVVEWKVIDDFSDDRSAIWQEQDGVHLAGRIHNVLDYGDGKTVVDVYMQQGPEFFSVTSEAMDELSLDASTGLEIVVKTLYLQPTS